MRDVERGDGLVEDEQIRRDGQGPGDADALALAAGELVRIPVEVFRAQLYEPEQLVYTLLDLTLRHVVHLERLGEQTTHGEAWMQRGLRRPGTRTACAGAACAAPCESSGQQVDATKAHLDPMSAR